MNKVRIQLTVEMFTECRDDWDKDQIEQYFNRDNNTADLIREVHENSLIFRNSVKVLEIME